MSRVGGATAVLFTVLCMTAIMHSAHTQQPAAATAAQIHVNYDPPSDVKFRPIYDALKRRQVLERLQRFLTPLRLPKDLTVRLSQCGAEKMPYQSGGPVTICYEMVQRISEITSQNTKDADEQTVIVDGTFVETVLHEVAHAVFDILQVPIWGREEDAADRVAALIMIRFDDEVALTTIIGTAKFFEYSKHAWTGTDFAENVAPEAQRFYNYLCVAYGGDPITFSFLAPRPGPSTLPRLTAHRARWCPREYEQVRHAFDLRIMPFIDPDQVIKVRASQWMAADEVAGGLK